MSGGTALHYPPTSNPQSFLSSAHYNNSTSSSDRGAAAGATRRPSGVGYDNYDDNATVASSVYGEFIYLDDSTVTTEGGGGSVANWMRRASMGRRRSSTASSRSSITMATTAAAPVHPSANQPSDDENDGRVLFLDEHDSEVFVVDPTRQPPPTSSTARGGRPSGAADLMPMIHEDDEIIILEDSTSSAPSYGVPNVESTGCEKDPDKDREEDGGESDPDEHDGSADPVLSAENARPWFQTDANKHWFIWEFMQFQKTRSWKKKVLTIVVMLSSIYVIVDLIFLGNVQQWINASLLWMTAHPFLASVSFFGLFVVTSLMFVPITPLVFASGFCFVSVAGGSLIVGAAVALVLSFLSLVVGAVLSFLRARYMSQDIVRLFATRYPIVKAADRALQRKGFKIMLLLRLCPIIPFNGLNYIGGVMSVSLTHFTCSLVGMLPTIILWVLVGATSKSLAEASINDQSLQVYMGVLLGVGLWVAVLALFITWKVASKELRREIESNSAENWFRYRDDSQAPSHNDEDEIDDEGENDEDGVASASGTAESSSHYMGGVDPLALSALNASHNPSERPAPRSPEYERAAWELPRPPLPQFLSPLLPPRIPFPGVFDDLDGMNGQDDDAEIIFIPHPGNYGNGMMDGVHDEYRDVEIPLHEEYHPDDYHLEEYYDDDGNDDAPHHPDELPYHPHHHAFLSRNWLLSQLGIGYGMDTYDSHGDPHGRDTDLLWLWA